MRFEFRPGIRFLQTYFVLGILLLGGFWFFYTRGLFRRLEDETQTRSRIYARYVSQLVTLDTASTESDIIFSEVIRKIDFPIIVTDPSGSPTSFRNLGEEKPSKERLLVLAKRLDQEHHPIPIMAVVDSALLNLGYVHYGQSPSVKMLRLFPFFQLGFLFIFLILGLWGILIYKRGEEEHIWTALAKETAHQLGTPLSSLSGWLEVLKTEKKNRVLPEMEGDLQRVSKVLERFSRIGLPPALKPERLRRVIEDTVSFISRRAHKDVEFVLDLNVDPVVLVDEVLFTWTLENLLRNSLDAIGHNPGRIGVATRMSGTYLELLVSDSGEGVKLKGDEIFKAGVTTKAHGWGLGLPLAKRIVEEFHKGRLSLVQSGPKGSVFRVLLPVKG